MLMAEGMRAWRGRRAKVIIVEPEYGESPDLPGRMIGVANQDDNKEKLILLYQKNRKPFITPKF